jgi:site-specific recombinase XerD
MWLPCGCHSAIGDHAAASFSGGTMIGLREIRALEKNGIIWDSGKGAVAGFGARRRSGTVVTYLLKYRTKGGRQRWHTIGRHGSPWTPETARDKAVALLGKIVEGADPAAEKQVARQAKTVAELCDIYLSDAEAGRLLTRRKVAKKASTLATDRGRIERHIKPLLGRMLVAAVDSADIDRFMHAVAVGDTAARIKTKKRGLARVRGGKGTASRTVGLLGAIFTYAVRNRMRNDNPVRGVMRFADGRRERRLTNEEYGFLGAGLRQATADGIWPAGVDATRFLALTGWRVSEATELPRTVADHARRTARLPDTKSGYSVRPLSHLACDILRDARGIDDRELVFPPTRGKVMDLSNYWRRIAEFGGLPRDITPNVLRHSFISLASDLGYSEATIAALVGHKGHTITSRYIHSADAVLLAAADTIANRIAEMMGDAPQHADVVPIRAGA